MMDTDCEYERLLDRMEVHSALWDAYCGCDRTRARWALYDLWADAYNRFYKTMVEYAKTHGMDVTDLNVELAKVRALHRFEADMADMEVE